MPSSARWSVQVMKDAFFVVCDGLKGPPEVVGNVWPLTTVQTCIIHLIRHTFRLASRRDWDAIKHDVKPIYTAVKATAARAALDELTEKWGTQHPTIIRLWNNAWEEFIPFLDYDIEIRTTVPFDWRWTEGNRGILEPTPNDRVRELVKAGALIAAEIDRMLRAG